MLFNSLEFAAFFPLVLALYWLCTQRRQNAVLLVASYLFYAAWNPRFLLLLWASTLVDFFAARAMHRTADARVRKRWLLASLCTNLGALGFFKYFGFFVESASELFQALGFGANHYALEIILPVGISFYTFQTLGYSIDVYRRQREPVHDIVDFALFVAYFPQLVAGPIERSTQLIPQLQRSRHVDHRQLASGAELILIGYLKKIAIADAIAPWVEPAFNDPTGLSAATLWISVYLFALQIYCDFSGYTDIARGVSRCFGIELIRNFRQPYLSRNVTEFWRRWHISLSNWLRDYLYIPMGGNRGGRVRTYRNLMATMLIGGLWHGASWTFVAWGGLHGLFLAVHRAVVGNRRREEREPSTPGDWLRYAFGVLVTFHLVCVAWVFFRAESLGDAVTYVAGLVPMGGELDLGLLRTFAFYAALMLAIDWPCWRSERELPWTSTTPAALRGVVYAAAVLMISFVGSSEVVPFIYFQF